MIQRLHCVMMIGLSFAVAPMVTPAQNGKGTLVKPMQTWQAKIADEARKKAAPAHGFISNAKEFASLWNAWRAGEKAPEIDFTQNLVLVGLAGGPNSAGIGATLEADGNLKVVVRQTLIGGPGFGYQLAVVPRAGIKTVNGKVVPAQ